MSAKAAIASATSHIMSTTPCATQKQADADYPEPAVSMKRQNSEMSNVISLGSIDYSTANNTEVDYDGSNSSGRKLFQELEQNLASSKQERHKMMFYQPIQISTLGVSNAGLLPLNVAASAASATASSLPTPYVYVETYVSAAYPSGNGFVLSPLSDGLFSSGVIFQKPIFENLPVNEKLNPDSTIPSPPQPLDNRNNKRWSAISIVMNFETELETAKLPTLDKCYQQTNDEAAELSLSSSCKQETNQALQRGYSFNQSVRSLPQISGWRSAAMLKKKKLHRNPFVKIFGVFFSKSSKSKSRTQNLGIKANNEENIHESSVTVNGILAKNDRRICETFPADKADGKRLPLNVPLSPDIIDLKKARVIKSKNEAPWKKFGDSKKATLRTHRKRLENPKKEKLCKEKLSEQEKKPGFRNAYTRLRNGCWLFQVKDSKDRVHSYVLPPGSL